MALGRVRKGMSDPGRARVGDGQVRSG